MMGVRLLVADDHEIVRKGLRALLETEAGWEVAEAVDGSEAVEKAQQIKPDVAILDISMPSLNGLEAARQIVKSVAQTKVLVLTMYDSDPLVQQMLEAGARGYVLKSDAEHELVKALNVIAGDGTYVSPGIDQHVAKQAVLQESRAAH